MRLEKAQLRLAWEADRKRARCMMLLAVLLTVVVFLICLAIKYEQFDRPGVFMPGRYYHSLLTRLGIALSGIVKGNYWHQRENLIAAIGIFDYGGALARLKVTGMAAAAGAGLAVAGAVFQTIYKNPMASPNMLGATAGVQLGNIIMVMMYSIDATALIVMRYKLCYGLTAICVCVVIILGKLAGDRTGNPSVLKMVMAGSIISQGLGTIAMYYMYQLADEDLLVYQQISMGTYIDTKNISLILFFILMAGSLIPMLLLRYRFNVTGIDDGEARAAGVNPAPYRLAGQICGVIMVTAAMIHCGEAGMLSMVIPFIVRSAVGSDFRKVFSYSALAGASLMMVCRTAATSIALRNSVGDILIDANFQIVTLPVSFIVNICLLPFFMIILAKQRSAFE